jgi:pSer/pThr/pTyr-binding forkhead associated (FHA) protein
MPFRLRSLTDNPDIVLDKPIVLVGRHQECDVQIHSRKISRKHCCIAQVNDYVVVRDLFSTNGVSINGQRVEVGSLKIGDELSIAHFRYQVTVGGKESQSDDGPEDGGQPVTYDDPADVGSGPATERALGEDSES